MARPGISIKFRDEDLARLKLILARLNDRMKKKVVTDSMYAGGKLDLEYAQLLVPKKTKKLLKSLAVRKKSNNEGRGAIVLARRSAQFPGGYYSHLVEKGHKIFRTVRGGKKVYIGYFSGHPFMRPSVEQNYEKIIERITQTAAKGVQEAVK